MITQSSKEARTPSSARTPSPARSLWPVALMTGEIAGIATIYTLAVWMTLYGPLLRTLAAYFPCLLIFLACWLGAAANQGLWSFRGIVDLKTVVPTLLKAAGYAVAFTVAFMQFAMKDGIESRFLMLFSAGGITVVLGLRTFLRAGVWAFQRAFHGEHKVLIVGANERTKRLLTRLSRKRGYVVEGVLDDDAERGAAFRELGTPYLGPCAAFEAVAQQRAIDEVYVGLTVRSQYDAIRQLVQLAEKNGVLVHMMAGLFQVRYARNVPMYIKDTPVVAFSAVPEGRFALAMKRTVDILVSSMLLAMLSPAFLLTAVLIKFDSKGPIFFLQERVGRNQRRFKIIKFRSMVVNAEELQKALAAQNEASGPVFKIRKDPRVTRLGAFMRKHSIDEFPQLINVWKGEMSLVGPRPPIPAEVAEYQWEQRRRLSVKPGMTGLWQVSGRNSISFDDWVRLDLAYIDSWSIFQDFAILFKTFREVVQGRNAA